jgi:subtilisin family serine protease
MAAPHVAGAAALYLQSNPSATAQQVRDALYDATTRNIVTSSKTANNHLLFVGSSEPPPASGRNLCGCQLRHSHRKRKRERP